jgi:hypothetical protein
VNHWQALVNWVRKEGGLLVHDYLEIRPSHGYNGLFTKGRIEENDILFRIPRVCMMTGPSHHRGVYADRCTAAVELAKHFELGEQSNFAPYTNYL